MFLCPTCEKENSPVNIFCVYCGIELPREGDESQEADSSSPIESAVRSLRREIAQLLLRIEALEGGAAPVAAATAPLPALVHPVAAVEAETIFNVKTDVYASPGQQRSTGMTPPAPALPQKPRDPGWWETVDWEGALGKNWFAIIGAVALVVGTGFFLRLAFENDWIGETGRVLLGLFAGFVLLGVGAWAARRIPVWARAVTGGGIAVLYLSIYAAFGFYDLLSPLAAISFLGMLSVLGALLAIRYESLVIALLSLFGAFLTPTLLDQNLADQRYALLAYLLVVDLGILGVATFRTWRWFVLIGMLASYALLGAWIVDLNSGELLLAETGAAGVFVIFVGATTLVHVLWKREPGPLDLSLMTLNAIAFFGITYGVMWEQYEAWFGLITLSLAAFYGVLGYASIKRPGAPSEVALYLLATGLLFLTIAAPLQLTGTWITVAWAAEGAVLTWVGFRVESPRMRGFALGVFAIAAFRLVAVDTFDFNVSVFTPILNERFPTFVVAIVALCVAAYIYHRQRAAMQEWEQNIETILLLAANGFTLWILSAEIISFYEARMYEEGGPFSPGGTKADTARLSALTTLWTLYGAGLVAIAFARRSVMLRLAGLAVTFLAVAKLVLVDTFAIGVPRGDFLPVINFNFLSAALILALMVFTAYQLRRHARELYPGEAKLFITFVVMANLVALWALSAESWRYFTNEEITAHRDLLSAKHLFLTVLWTVYATGVILVGIWRTSTTVRLVGMALLALPVVKLFVFDVFLLDRGYRVVAFVTLGVLLLALGLAYQRYSEALRGFFFGKRART
jgi:uncharacterized membrane protein